jgi:glutamate racemase
MIVIDSGLGGLAVVRALRALAPDIALGYVADTGGFPYGKRSAENITARAIAIVAALEKQQVLSTIVLACNTLSTLSLANLRSAFPQYHFVGTVPAIKVAAAQSRTRRFTLLATPNTAGSEYSKKLIAEFAADCVVDSYGAPNLAAMAEQQLLGEAVDGWEAEIVPAFHNDAQGKPEAVILGCTHYPLVLDALKKAAPWDVTWIDSSEAIARRALSQPGADTAPVAYVTSAEALPHYTTIFTREGFTQGSLLAVADQPPHAALA